MIIQFRIINSAFLLLWCLSCIICEDLPAIVINEAKDGDTIALSFTNYEAGNDDGILIEEMKIIPALGSVTIRATQIPSTVKFLVFQVHSFVYNATLSYNETILPNYHVNGTNIGLVKEPIGTTAQVFYKNFNLNKDITVLIAVQAYDRGDPVPGGCNMEFSVEIAPFLEVSYTSALVNVKSQLAAPPPPYSCSTGLIDYEVYHLYLTERDFESTSYFDGIRKMLTVNRIEKNGRKVPVPVGLSDLQRIFSAYPGTGSIYAVVAYDQRSPSASPYVPAVTYACSTIYWADTCEVLTSTFSKLLCAIIFFMGLFLCFVGHKFFKTEMFLFGFLSGGLVAFILVAMPENFDYGAHLLISVVLGIVFGGFWLSIWWFYGIPAISTVLVTLTLGYLTAAVVYFAGTGDLEVFQNDMNYWIAFVCIIVAVPLVMVMAAHIANIVACSILGSFAVIAPIDHYIGSNLKYIIINTIRRATIKEFRTAVIDPPFQIRDLSLAVTWGILATMGILVQLYLQRNKPPFPPPPFGALQDRRDRMGFERQPLLAGDTQFSYATMTGDNDDVFNSPVPGPSTA